MSLALVALLFLPLGATAQELLPLPTQLPIRYGVLGLRVYPTVAETLQIAQIHWQSPAITTDLQSGDRLLGIGSYRLRTPAELERYIQSVPPDTLLTLHVLRDGYPLDISVSTIDISRLYAPMGTLGLTPGQHHRDRHTRWSASTRGIENSTSRLFDRHNANLQLENLKRALQFEAKRYAGDYRLQDVHYGLHNPFKLPQMAADLAGDFLPSAQLQQLLANAAQHLDLTLPPTTAPGIQLPSTWLALNNDPLSLHLARVLFFAGTLVKSAFAQLDADQFKLLRQNAPELLALLNAHRTLEHSRPPEVQGYLHTFNLAKSVDLTPLFLAAIHLADLASPQGVKTLRTLIKKAGLTPLSAPPKDFSGRFLLAHYTPWGWLIIGDKGPNIYRADALFILDLGGDDIYLNNCGAPSPKSPAPFGMLIDLEGNDHYLGATDASIGVGLGGVGLLVDLDGNDLYKGNRLTQGAAFCGIGLLWDHKGRDRYLAESFAQGAALFGAGILVDDQGDDFYSATLYSQALASARGFGLLADRQGNDYYLAQNRAPSSYGPKDRFDSWSQGVGVGLRGFSAGGIALLLDSGGDDLYYGGNFSQGTGYFFGWGALVDQKGKDHYTGGRYAQGAAAHQALGSLLDYRGDDRYHSLGAAAQGAAWDVAVGCLEDHSGNDQYSAGELAQGAAAMNGIGLLFDWDGRDTYQATTGQGHSGKADYWGGRSAGNLGILIDSGNDQESYSRPQRQDNSTIRTSDLGLFWDY